MLVLNKVYHLNVHYDSETLIYGHNSSLLDVQISDRVTVCYQHLRNYLMD